MKAAFVLLADSDIQNDARRIVFALNSRWQIPFYASLLPAHVSLKQPFAFENMDTLEAYFDRLAASIRPFEITLDRYDYSEWNGYGILGMQVVESPLLRGLHDRLNAELPGIVRDASAPHDGSSYRFHLTIEMGKLDSRNGFQEFYDSLPEKEVERKFTARELAMFYYPDDAIRAGSFITYRIRPLGG